MNIIASIVGIAIAIFIVLAIGLVLFSAWTARQVEKRLPPRGRFIDVDGARIHYLDEGSGPALLLVHGLAGQMHNFTHSLFDRLKREHRVSFWTGRAVAIPRGPLSIGGPWRPGTDHCPLFRVAWARAAVSRRPLAGRSHRADAGANHPEQVGGLALIAPVTHPMERVPPPFDGIEITSPLVRRIVAWTLATPLSIANRALALETLFGPQAVASDFATKGGGLLNLRPCSFISASSI